MSKYDIEAIRKKLKETQGGRRIDPDEFKPEKANSTTEAIKYRFFILPPFNAGDMIKGGKATRDMGVQCFIQHGQHWVHNKPYPCPRVYNGEECKLCTIGFDLYKELKEERIGDDERKARKQNIGKKWMPTTFALANIYFTNYKANPDNLKNTVRFYNFPQSCVNLWEATLAKDGPGDDPEEPQPFGVFYDETAAYLFELSVLKQGKSNSYATSKFLWPAKPLSAEPKGIDLILNLRHNLFSKIEEPKPDVIAKLADQLLSGDDPPATGRGFDHDEQNSGEPVSTKGPAASATPAKTKPAANPKPASAKATKPAAADDEEPDVGDQMNGDLDAETPLPTTEASGDDDSNTTSPEIARLLSQLKDDE